MELAVYNCFCSLCRKLTSPNLHAGSDFEYYVARQVEVNFLGG